MPRKTRLTALPPESTFHRFAYDLGEKTPIKVNSGGYNSFSVPLDLVESHPPYITEYISGLTIADMVMNGEVPDLRNNPKKTLEARIHLTQAVPQIVLFNGKLYGKVILSDGSITYEPESLHCPNPETDFIVGKKAAWMYAQELGFPASITRFNWLIRGRKEKVTGKKLEVFQKPVLTYFQPIWKRRQGSHGMPTGSLKIPLFIVADVERAVPLYTGNKPRPISQNPQ